MPTVRLEYPLKKDGTRQPNKQQAAFHTSDAKYRAYVGGVGAGKTLAGCMEAIKLSYILPGNRGLIGANTYPQLRDATQKTFFSLCPPELIKEYLKQENRVIFKNGSEIIFRSFDDYSKFQGLEIGFFYMDEASEAPKEIFDILTSRLRNAPIPDNMYRGFLTTNPNGKNWVYDKFFTTVDPDYFGVVSTTYDNKDNLPAGYIENMEKSYSAEWVKRFLHGSFDTFSGQIFSEFQESIHVTQPATIPDHWYRFRAIDFGWSNPTAVLWAAESPEGELYIYRELYRSELSAFELAEQITNLSGKERFEYTVGDTSGAAVSQTDGESIYSQLYEYKGIQVQPAYKQDKLGRIDRVKTMFRHNQIYVFNTCVNLIKELPQYQWESPKHNSTLTQQRPLKINDHAIDALLYLCGSRPDRIGLPKVPKPAMSLQQQMETVDPMAVLTDLAKREKKGKVKVYY